MSVLGNALRRTARANVCGETSRRALFGASQIPVPTRPQCPLGRTPTPSSDLLRAIHTSPPRASSTWRTEPPTPPTNEVNMKEELPAQLRGVMRRLAHSVVVCTSTDRDGRPRGMTMSSFVSLSMDPVPLVSFNVRTPSRTLAAIEDLGGRFNVHVLAEGEAGARVAEWFTRGNSDGEVFKELPSGVEVEEEDGEAPLPARALPAPLSLPQGSLQVGASASPGTRDGIGDGEGANCVWRPTPSPSRSKDLELPEMLWATNRTEDASNIEAVEAIRKMFKEG
ncbi:flavin reductase like domain-containing protein [Colletotrichum gloeosporioides Cg-14]|uniref:Flavin reductase like domain-containing protein n=1 Tax=Colletotrichum gloeosporioides (strain Cg-14) TaxID=1237896 RepID=T0L3Z0_COLGC|nr:flavin reductase like domain-containing protein [Colletotrichum gloeosporioides Cg-14]